MNKVLNINLGGYPFTIDDGVEVTAAINTDELFLTDTINCFGASNGIASVLNAKMKVF